MKLLPKKVINTQVASQKKAQIDEGIQLAQRVDVLRETKLKEEGNLNRFRTETVSMVQAEIDIEIRKRDALKEEISELLIDRQYARVPLDAEWTQLEIEKSSLSEKNQEIDSKSSVLHQREVEIESRENENALLSKKTKELDVLAQQKLSEADTTLENSRQMAAEIRNSAQETLVEVELKEATLNLREKQIEMREGQVEKTARRQLKKDIEQAAHDKTIKDKYETLERTIKRLHG